jgi:hypothetical protein
MPISVLKRAARRALGQFRGNVSRQGRACVYTCLFGNYGEPPEQPVARQSSTPFICFTDNPKLRSDCWQIRVVEPLFSFDPRRSSRHPKICAHEYLRDFELSLYIDSTIRLRADPAETFSALFHSQPFNMACLHHSRRLTVEAEFEAVRYLKYDEAATLNSQYADYAARGYAFADRPIWGGFLLRRHHADDVVSCMRAWFGDVLRYSTRDQLSFNFAARQTRLQFTAHPLQIDRSPFHEWPVALTRPRDAPRAGSRLRWRVSDRKLVARSGLFDESWYVRQLPAGAPAPADPLGEYLRLGASSERAPHRLFDQAWYLAQNPDVAKTGVNPLVHYLRFGANEGRNPSRQFDGAWYLRNNLDVARLRVNPLVHFMKFGAAEGRKTRPVAPTGMDDEAALRASRNLAAKIEQKWPEDCRHLPLTPAHRELYDIIHRLVFREFGEFPNLIDCRDFNDRMQWLKLFDQRREMVRCSDKILARDYIRERIGEKHLVKLYQTHERFSQIDFAALPQAFVIKANHDAGSTVLVRDKAKLDKAAAEARIEAGLRRQYGWETGEWAYKYVRPRVLVEELLDPHSASPPPDYKFYCVEGKVKFMHYVYDRGLDPKSQIIDANGADMKTQIYPVFALGDAFRKPDQWDELIEVAERLSSAFKFVRVDLYCVGGRIYAGEMTFWPSGGVYHGDGQKRLGPLLDFDRTTVQPFLLPELDREAAASAPGARPTPPG